MNISREDSRLRVHIELDALYTYKDGDYLEFDISYADAIALRDRLDILIDSALNNRLNSMIDVMDEICKEGEE